MGFFDETAKKASEDLSKADPFRGDTSTREKMNGLGQTIANYGTFGAAATPQGTKFEADTSKGWRANVTDPARHVYDKVEAGINNMFAPAGGGAGAATGGFPSGAFGINTPTAPTGTSAQTVNVQGAGTDAQNQALKYLQAQANGSAPSVVAQQYAQAQQNQQAALMSQLASQRGGVNPLAARMAMQQNAQGQAQLAQGAGTARLQEQQQAQQALGNLSIGARNADVSVAATNANLGQAYQDLQARYMGMGLDAEKARAQAAMDIQKLELDRIRANNQTKAGIFGALSTVAGALVNMYTGQPTTSSDPNAVPADNNTNVANTIFAPNSQSSAIQNPQAAYA